MLSNFLTTSYAILGVCYTSSSKWTYIHRQATVSIFWGTLCSNVLPHIVQILMLQQPTVHKQSINTAQDQYQTLSAGMTGRWGLHFFLHTCIRTLCTVTFICAGVHPHCRRSSQRPQDKRSYLSRVHQEIPSHH